MDMTRRIRRLHSRKKKSEREIARERARRWACGRTRLNGAGPDRGQRAYTLPAAPSFDHKPTASHRS